MGRSDPIADRAHVLAHTETLWRELRGARLLITGGSKFDEAIGSDLYDLGLTILQAYGLTETSPVATVAALPGDLQHADEETQFDYVALQGLPLPLVELRAERPLASAPRSVPSTGSRDDP
mgnify:CR=1 FL=1